MDILVIESLIKQYLELEDQKKNILKIKQDLKLKMDNIINDLVEIMCDDGKDNLNIEISNKQFQVELQEKQIKTRPSVDQFLKICQEKINDENVLSSLINIYNEQIKTIKKSKCIIKKQ